MCTEITVYCILGPNEQCWLSLKLFSTHDQPVQYTYSSNSSTDTSSGFAGSSWHKCSSMSAVNGGSIILLNHGRSGGLQQVPGNAVYVKAWVEQCSVRPCPPSLQEFHTCCYCPPPPVIVWRCTWAMPFVGGNVCITMLHCTLLYNISTHSRSTRPMCMHAHAHIHTYTYRVWTNWRCMVAVMKSISHEWWHA